MKHLVLLSRERAIRFSSDTQRRNGKRIGLTIIAMARACLLAVALGTGGSHAQEQAKAADPTEVIADLTANSLSAEEIRSISRVAGMRVVSLEEFAGANLQRLQETLRETEDGLGEVQTAIESNEAFEAAIREAGVSLYRVVAITRDETGEFTAYTNAPSP